MTFYIFQTLLFAGLLNAAILMFALPQLPIQDRRPPILLGLLIFLIALSFVSFGILPRIRRVVEWVNLSHVPVNFFIGPLFLFLVRSIFLKNWKWKASHWLHLLPGILDLFLVISVWVYVASSPPLDRIAFFYQANFSLGYNGLLLVFSAFYLLRSIRVYQHAQLPDAKGKMYQLIFYGMCGLLSLWLLFFLIEMLQYPQPLCRKYFSPICLLALAFYLLIGYKVIINPKRITALPKKNSNLSEDHLLETFQQLQATIVGQGLYLNPDLNQAALINQLSVPEYLISKAVQKGGEQSFPDFINRLRVESFLKKLDQGMDQSFTLFSLAQESGFKSRATFYRAFKKHTGMTPGRYKAQHKKS